MSLHKCPNCNRSIAETKFSPKIYPNTLCRDCDNERAKEYRRSHDGMMMGMYSQMVKNSRDRKMEFPNFSKDELFTWLQNNNFDAIYNSYASNGYKSNDRPSIDRISDNLPYTFENMQLITWKENNDKAYKDRVEGRNIKQSRAILVFDLDGNFIKEGYSLHSVAREIGCRASHICDVASHKRRKQVYGFTFKYKDVA